MTEVVPVPPTLFSSVWMRVAPVLLKGLASAPPLTIQEAADHLVATTMQLWTVIEGKDLIGAFLTTLDKEGVLEVFALASANSKMPGWIGKVDDELEVFSQAYGGSKIRFVGRRAYERLLPKYKIVGRFRDQEIFEREISPAQRKTN